MLQIKVIIQNIHNISCTFCKCKLLLIYTVPYLYKKKFHAATKCKKRYNESVYNLDILDIDSGFLKLIDHGTFQSFTVKENLYRDILLNL